MKLQYAVMPVVVLLVSLCLHAQTSTPVSDHSSEVKHLVFHEERFPQFKAATCDSQEEILATAQLSVSARGATIDIHGVADNQKSWAAKIPLNGLGCEIYLSDLNQSGRQSIIVYTPGIGSMGAYDQHLYILLLDPHGQPVPWQATGVFNVSEQGVDEIRKSSQDGHAFILHNYAVGHPGWGGVSYISSAYQITGNRIVKMQGGLSGNKLPYVSGANSTDPKFLDFAKVDDISTGTFSMSSVHGQHPLFLRFGASTSQVQAKPSSVESQNQNIMMDVNQANAAEEKIELSDGSRVDLPSILVVDDPHIRQIVFNPDGTDITSFLKSGVHAVMQEGNECEDVGFCHPFLLWAKK